MQPYINPNYFQYPQFQQYQMNQMSLNSINGRMIDNPSEITANDVTMDNNVSIFPKRDMSEIYCKRWNNNGTISTVVFKPCNDVPDHNDVSKIDDIIERLERIERSIRPNNRKKEIDNE